MLTQDEIFDTIIIENQYFPCINYIKSLFKFSNIIIDQYENYQKMSFRNRTVVAGSNGLVNLSIPLEQGRGQRESIKDVRISYQINWQKQHLRTLESCYSRAPFFEYYRDYVGQLIEKKDIFLLDKNLAILEWLQLQFRFSGKISLSENYQNEVSESVWDGRNYFLPKNFRLQPMGFTYTQVFEDRIGFIQNMGILDLLFCCGPQAKELLQGNKLTF